MFLLALPHLPQQSCPQQFCRHGGNDGDGTHSACCGGRNAARLATQYRQAAATSEAEASRLRKTLLALRAEYDHVRVVAHSLGCRMLMHAIEPLPAAARPDEVHLLAAAVQAEHAAARWRA